jgi:hypothetical protein
MILVMFIQVVGISVSLVFRSGIGGDRPSKSVLYQARISLGFRLYDRDSYSRPRNERRRSELLAHDARRGARLLGSVFW